MKIFLKIFLLLVLSSCTTFKKPEYGLNSDRIAYVPARVSVLSCMTLPKNDLIKFAKVTIDDAKLRDLCASVDAFIIEGFKNQPFMKGYTPKAVEKLITQSSNPNHLKDMNSQWGLDGAFCEECDNMISFYKSEVLTKNTWLTWLNQFSQITKFSDTILIPFIVIADQNTSDDRGLLISRNQAQLILLLIDTNNGEIIWSGQRSTDVEDKVLRGPGIDFPPFPEWKSIEQKLLVEAIWENFPGRQTL